MKRALLVVLLAGGFVVPLQAGTKAFSPFVPIENDTAVSDTGRWEIWQDNMGRFVRGPGFWPKHSGRKYLDGAGLWIGVIDPLRTRGDTAVSWSYNPNSGQSEFGPTTPDGNHNRYLDSLARMYDSSDPRDTAQWPERDSLGRAIIASDQELWCITNDLGKFMASPDSAIGIQVIRRTYAWNSPGDWGDIVKVEFDVKNVTGRWGSNPHTLPKVILGASMVADIGRSSLDDLVYLDSLTGSSYPNLVVQYQLIQEPGWRTIPPPYYVGFRCFVETPKATDTVRVRDDEYPRAILPGEFLGTTAIKIYTNQSDPQNAFERYLYLKGMFSLNDTNDAYGGSGDSGDKRFLASCGPFSLPNDSTVRLSMYIIGGRSSSEIRRKAELLGVESPPGPVARNASGVVLYPSIPNPVSSFCLIRYALPEPSQVSLKVYDISGRLVRELEKGMRFAGANSARWDGRDEFGKPAVNGVYFYRLEVSDKSWVRKTVLLH